MKNFFDKKVIALIVSILLVVSVLANSTYSLLFKSNESGTSNYTTGTLTITSSTTNNSVTLSNSLPMEDSAGLSSTAYTFQINNTGTVAFKFDVKLLSTTTTNQIDSQYIKVSVNGGAARTLSSLTNGMILSDVNLAAGASTSVTLRVWLASNTPNSQIGKVFNAKIVTDGQTLSYSG